MTALSIARAGVVGRAKISATVGGLAGPLENGDRFGASSATLGDLDGDGISDVAVGAPLDDAGGLNRGAVWILFMNSDGTVKHQVRIAEPPGFGGLLADGDAFGFSLTAPGDIDEDGLPDLVVGAPFDDDGGENSGALWILTLAADGSATSSRKLGASTPALADSLTGGDYFGRSVASLGDLNDDGGMVLAVGAPGDDREGPDRGAIWILRLTADDTLYSARRMADPDALVGPLADGDRFGSALAVLDGVAEAPLRLAVGARFDDDGGPDRGAVWLLRLSPGAEVVSAAKVSQTQGGFPGTLGDRTLFGTSLTTLGTGTSCSRLVVGASGDEGLGSSARGGAVWILCIDSADQVQSALEIRMGEGGFEGTVDPLDAFGSSVTTLDLGSGGLPDLVIGAEGDDDGGKDHGAVWLLTLDDLAVVSDQQKISDLEGGFGGGLLPGDRFGAAAVAVGDLDGDGVAELAVGAPDDDQGGVDRGVLWILFLHEDGTVKNQSQFTPELLDPALTIEDGDRFAKSLAIVDLQGVRFLAVGAPGDDDGQTDAGAVWMLRLTEQGAVVGATKISAEQEPLGSLGPQSAFGSAVAAAGDLDGDGTSELAVGSPWDGDYSRGAVWILFLHPDGTVRRAIKINDVSGGFTGRLGNFDLFGSSITSLDDLDGDHRPELAVGAPQDGDGFLNAGAVWLLSLEADGTVAGESKISSLAGGFGTGLGADYLFGTSVGSAGDLDRDGITELVIGTIADDAIGQQRGSAWLVFLRNDGTVKFKERLLDGEGVLPPSSSISYNFGASAAFLPDLNGDGVDDIVVGATGADDGVTNSGALWILFLDGELSPRLSAVVPTGRRTIQVVFSERVLASGAEDVTKYDVRPTGSSDPVPVDMATQQPDGQTVVLTFGVPLEERDYSMIVGDVLDEAGNALAPDGRSIEFSVPPIQMQVRTPRATYQGWGLSVVPFEPTADYVLGSLGSQENRTRWRVSRWSPASNAYQEVGASGERDLSILEPGRGYWMVTRDPILLTVGGFPLPAAPFQIPLEGGPGEDEPPAWNQISNPFPFRVRVSDLLVSDGDKVVSMVADVENDLTSRVAKLWVDGAYRELGASQCLEPQTAVWIQKVASGPVQLVIPHVEAPEEACEPPSSSQPLPGPAHWMLILRASQENESSEPLVLGSAEVPAEGWNRLSMLVSPSPPDDRRPRLYVEESSWGRMSGHYARRFTSAAQRLQWEVWIEAATTPGQVTLELRSLSLPAHARLWWSEAEGSSRRPLRRDAIWTVAAAASPRPYVLTVDLTGETAAATAPRPSFSAPYPNPFRDRTGFRFLLVSPRRIEARVYDVAGRLVRTLTAPPSSPGERVLSWDGTDWRGFPVSAGVYLVRQSVEGGSSVTYRVARIR